MRIQEIVGANIRRAREDPPGWSQAQLGQFLAPFLGKAWSGQVVSQAEKGEREFTAHELVALATVLGRPIAWFFVPDDLDVKIDLPEPSDPKEEKVELSGKDLVYAVTGTTDDAPTASRQRILGTVEDIRAVLGDLQGWITELEADVTRHEETALIEEHPLRTNWRKDPEVLQRYLQEKRAQKKQATNRHGRRKK